MNRLILGLAAFASIATALPAVSNAQTVNQRQDNQQARIGQGVASGQLTPGETSNLEHREAGIHRTEARMRYRSGGHLTWSQRHRLQHRENRVSHAIYRDKHNGRTY